MSFLLRSLKINAGGAEPRRARFFLFYFLSPRIRSKRIGPPAPPNSSCDDIWFVLASLSNEVRSNTPYHSTPHTRDTLRTGRDWPVKPTIHQKNSRVRLLTDSNHDRVLNLSATLLCGSFGRERRCASLGLSGVHTLPAADVLLIKSRSA